MKNGQNIRPSVSPILGRVEASKTLAVYVNAVRRSPRYHNKYVDVDAPVFATTFSLSRG